MIAQLTPEREFRGQGCSEACVVVKAIIPGQYGRSELLLHDPETHEQYGRIATGADGSAIVWTGSLVIDRWAKTVTSDGRPVRLTPREWDLLDYLAANIGRACPLTEIEAAIWGEDMWSSEGHLTRVNVSRVREKLGQNRGMIETNPGLGYRLLRVEPREAVAS